ncbi:bifunctional hydroxymethylpyrimidine kinase/phosphomethylpyrimidine kinase [Ottowia thiooxydans]|uniref:bifunctional hydroxymethylpyrimidine kinase/phosphomethylpyrimidine kinase n=1 Tax=Ottowia thiooxydans TaxID=219182 RepID=UPI0004004F53|nr:bifunctional hydroxymethylpyrimidine kinase/phosphomethylpyrimidine kinase [Ottowia thiooxydans]
MPSTRPPLVWSIAGNDSGGGAGLSADQRAAVAFGVHLCPVVAAITAQSSVGVTRIEAVASEMLEAQLAALAEDMPPTVIKTGMLGSVGNVMVVARWVDKLRAQGPVSLVIDPVMGASTGASFANGEMLQAYREWLLPRATLITPNESEARRLAADGQDASPALTPKPCAPTLSPEGRGSNASLVGGGSEARRLAADGRDASLALTPKPGAPTLSPEGRGSNAAELMPADLLPLPEGERAGVRVGGASISTTESIPTIARTLRALGSAAVAITCGDSSSFSGQSVDWIDTPHAAGWLTLPRVDTPNNHGTGCTFATSAAAAMALGFVVADALVLAKMATTQALRNGYAAGQGAGPVAAQAGFATEPELMPWMSWGENIDFSAEPLSGSSPFLAALDLYAIVDSAERVAQVVATGVKTVQLRVKEPPTPDDAWRAALREAIKKSVAACHAAGALLIVNDHWQLAHDLGASAVHVGQEDLLALGEAGRAALARTGVRVGISSHSLWELARARTLSPLYVACGPVWPTLTKDMPWHAQGLDNLAWWVQMAGVPVVAIGGILEPAQLSQAASSGASGVCVVRGIGDNPSMTIPVWQAALEQGRAAQALPIPNMPHPSLDA